MKKLKCPKCGSVKIKWAWCFNKEADGEYAVFSYLGNCAECEAPLKWDVEYTISGYGKIEIDE